MSDINHPCNFAAQFTNDHPEILNEKAETYRKSNDTAITNVAVVYFENDDSVKKDDTKQCCIKIIYNLQR